MLRNICLSIICIGFVFFNSCAGIYSAKVLLAEHKYPEAIKAYKTYLKNNPEDITAQSDLGYAYYQDNQLDQAIQTFQNVLQRNPDDPMSVLYLGMIYVKQKKFHEAINQWQGYQNKNHPELENEIKRQLTILQISESHRAAKAAMAMEQGIGAVKTDPNTVAVFNFKDLSEDNQLKPFQKGLAAMIMTGLSKSNKIKVVERVRLQALFEEMKLGQSGLIDESTAPKVGQLLGADKLVTGTLSLGIHVSTSIASVSKQTVEGSVALELEKEKFYEMPMKIIENIAKYFGIDLSIEELHQIRQAMPSNYNAFVHYCNALEFLDQGNWEKSSDELDMAIQVDPNFGEAQEKKETCPLASAPPISQIKTMNVQQVAQYVSTSINRVMTGGTIKDSEMIQPEPPQKVENVQAVQEVIIQQEKVNDTIQETTEIIIEEIQEEKAELPDYPGLPHDD